MLKPGSTSRVEPPPTGGARRFADGHALRPDVMRAAWAVAIAGSAFGSALASDGTSPNGAGSVQSIAVPADSPAPLADRPAVPGQDVGTRRAAPVGAGSAGAESRLSETLLEGLILDATVTPRGRDFYRAFVDAWRLLDARTRYTVTLRELPSPRQGSIVSVEFRGRAVLRAALSPNRAVSVTQSEQFARAAYESVLEDDAERLLFPSPDLAREEL